MSSFNCANVSAKGAADSYLLGDGLNARSSTQRQCIFEGNTCKVLSPGADAAYTVRYNGSKGARKSFCEDLLHRSQGSTWACMAQGPYDQVGYF